jgi:predicted RNase H-like HicB family nuclease
MQRIKYVAIVHKEPTSAFGVSFPDLPGCVSAGETLDEALVNAQEALEGHIEVSAELGEALAPPRTKAAVTRALTEEDRKDLVGVHVVEVKLTRKRINISVDATELALIDRAATAARKTRSQFLMDAALQAARG